MADYKKYKDDYILFLEAGFIAVNQMDEPTAVALFKAAELLKPDNIMPQIGIGYLHLCKFELKQAAKCFEEILAKEPANEMAKTFLGLVYSLNPQEMAKGEKLLTETAKISKDASVKKLAGDAINFVDMHLKKGGSFSSGKTEPRKQL